MDKLLVFFCSLGLAGFLSGKAWTDFLRGGGGYPDFAAVNPNLPRWFLDDRTDLSARLAELHMSVLLLWGDADPISPVRVGQRLAELLPRAEMHVIPGGGHDLGFTHAGEVARLIDRHLAVDGGLRSQCAGRG